MTYREFRARGLTAYVPGETPDVRAAVARAAWLDQPAALVLDVDMRLWRSGVVVDVDADGDHAVLQDRYHHCYRGLVRDLRRLDEHGKPIRPAARLRNGEVVRTADGRWVDA